jgi:hypothetical protein
MTNLERWETGYELLQIVISSIEVSRLEYPETWKVVLGSCYKCLIKLQRYCAQNGLMRDVQPSSEINFVNLLHIYVQEIFNKEFCCFHYGSV